MAEKTSSALIWSTADLLRGDYRRSDYGKIILPFILNISAAVTGKIDVREMA